MTPDHFKFTSYSSILPSEFNLTRDDSGASRVYRDILGNVYTSVTSFLSSVSGDKPELEQWRNSIGDSEADRITKLACDKGTAIHLDCESFLLNKPNTDVSIFYREDFNTMKKHLQKYVNNIFSTEHQMFSDTIQLAGTVDLIAEYNGKMSIIDFKTASRMKYKSEISNYLLQCGAYSIMAWERYRLKINQLVILMVVEGDPMVQVFIEPSVKWMKEIIKLTNKE